MLARTAGSVSSVHKELPQLAFLQVAREDADAAVGRDAAQVVSVDQVEHAFWARDHSAHIAKVRARRDVADAAVGGAPADALGVAAGVAMETLFCCRVRWGNLLCSASTIPGDGHKFACLSCLAVCLYGGLASA